MLDALPSVKNEPVLIVSGNDVIDPVGYKNLLKAAAKKGVDGALLDASQAQDSSAQSAAA
jgi:hypothetical protein